MLIYSPSVFGQDSDKKQSAFRDSADNAFDISDWLIDKNGVLLIPSIITEPAVGYGAMAAAIYFHSSYSEKKGPPSMSGAFGGLTANGTWAAGIFHMGYWKQDRLRYTGAVAKTYVNLEFYGSGLILGDNPINMNLDAWVILQQLKGRLGDSKFFLGGKYMLLDTYNTFELPIDIPDYTGSEFASTLSEASVILNYDSRNNVFTTSRGFFLQATGTYSDKWFGGDDLYGRLSIDAIGYFPLSNKVFVGTRFKNNYSFGDVPFYARPMVQLRGVPLMKFQNRNTIEFETEVNVNITKRWSVIAFTGMGTAYKSLDKFKNGKSVQNLGTGFRYLLMRKFGARMGMDFAISPDDFAFYFVFGSSWPR